MIIITIQLQIHSFRQKELQKKNALPFFFFFVHTWVQFASLTGRDANTFVSRIAR